MERKFKCLFCDIEFEEEGIEFSGKEELTIFCPGGCIIGTVYIPDICQIEELEQKERG